MKTRPLASITLMTTGFSMFAAAMAAALLLGAGRPDWSLGVLAGWAAGSLNTALLARRVSLLTGRSTVAGFLYGMASRFALVGAIAMLAYRLLGASLLGFALGIALVILTTVPVTVVWSVRQEGAS